MNISAFEAFNLTENILTALNKLGYTSPTKVQQEVLPLALADRDIIVKSQTGSGKTAAFAIPICEKIEVENREPQALILVPTRELAVQVKDDISNIGRLKKVRCAAVFGKQPVEMQKNELKQRVHAVVGTPGRTLDHIERGNINLENIKYLVLDEADEMLSMGFIEQVEAILNKLPNNRVTLLLSATIPEVLEKLCDRYMNNAAKIDISPEKLTVEKINQYCIEVPDDKKFNTLKKLLYIENPDSCIIFCRTKENVDILSNKMKLQNYSCDALHGGMLQKDRLNTMESFKRGEFRFLVATDVAARGIDVESISHIINYDLPMEKESYVHRIGRTGRNEHSGVAITFFTSYEHRFLNEIEEFINSTIPRKDIPSFEEAEKNKNAFLEKNKVKPQLKKKKGDELNKEITKLYINAGKKKKIRPGDIVGAISNIEGLSAEDIGIINIEENFSHIDILNGKGNLVLNKLKQSTIKGKSVRIEKATK